MAGLRLRRVKLLTGIKADITHIAIDSLVRSPLHLLVRRRRQAGVLLRPPHLPLSVLPRLRLPLLPLSVLPRLRLPLLPLSVLPRLRLLHLLLNSRHLRLDRSLLLNSLLLRLDRSLLLRLDRSLLLRLDRSLLLLRVRLNLGQTRMGLRISPVL